MNSITLPDGVEIGEDGVWCQVLARPLAPSRQGALFLDRDGVLVEEVRYLSKVEDMQLTAGAIACVKTANKLGIPVVVVTNQSGVGRGYYGWQDFADIQDAMLEELAAGGAFINAVFACPHHKDGNPPYNVDDHPARKPNPGMLLEAAARMPIDLSHSWIVGDRAGDVAACKRAGGCGGVHVTSGHGDDTGEQRQACEYASEDFVVKQLSGIADVTELLPTMFEKETGATP